MRGWIGVVIVLVTASRSASGLDLIKHLAGPISPKSVVASGNGLFFAQNMMYRHTITVYNRQFALVKTIPDAVQISPPGRPHSVGRFLGAPVECAFSDGGRTAWVSNYQMYGPGFSHPGSDHAPMSNRYDPGYLYRIDTQTLQIMRAIQVGAVPKYVAVTPDNTRVLVSNWCNADMSVVDTVQNREIRRVRLGAHPRGIAITPDSATAYVAVMGSYDIAVVSLKDYAVRWFRGIGAAPRHLCLDPGGRWLYATLNEEGRVAQIDTTTGKVVRKVATGRAPRSMVLSQDGRFLYVVNYNSNTVSKLRAADLRVLQTVATRKWPVGITFDPETKQVWVACYSGSLLVFQD